MEKGIKINLYKTFKYIIIFMLFTSVFILLILYRNVVSNSIYNSVNYCLSALYPSLFPFMFTSTLFSFNKTEVNFAPKG